MDTIKRALLRAGLAMGTMAGTSAAHAAVCAASVQALQNDFNLLVTVAQGPVTIRIEEGTYALGATGVYPIAPLTIEGGYVPGTNCSQRDANPDPSKTVLDFGGNGVAFMQLSSNPAAALTFDGLTLSHGHELDIQAGDAADDDVGNVTLKRVRITGFTGDPAFDYTAPVQLNAAEGNLVLENVVLDSMTDLPGNRCAVKLDMAGDSYANLRFVTAGLQGNDKFCVEPWVPSGARRVDIVDSLIWKVGAAGSPSLLNGLTTGNGGTLDVHLVNSGFADLDPLREGNWTVTNQISNAPNWFDAAHGDFHLVAPSTSIDGGTAQIPNGSVPPTDIAGNPRPYAGSRPDAGAYEYQVPSVPSTVVTNANDSGPGSLRQAIQNANANGGGNVTFDIQSGACPHGIFLASPLDPITTAITIDGTTQAGPVANTSPNAFNANLCVALLPNGAVGHALKVASDAPPGASLTVRGLFFGAFNQPLMLLGGSDHVVAGNQFGGTLGGLALPGAGLNAITIGGNATGSLIIGGDNPSDRNVVAGADSPLGAGIRVQSAISGCQIANNLIGLDADGVTARPNSIGVDLAGSGCSLRGNRVAYSSHDGIWVQGTDNVLERNVIGRDSNGQPAQNGGQYGEQFIGYGIHVSGSFNTIGLFRLNAYDGQFHANDVRFNAQGGIGVTAGHGNVIRGNVVLANGVAHDGSAMDIDLGGDGPTANLVPNPGTGPDGLQDHPLITGVVYPVPPGLGEANVDSQISGMMVGNPGTYQIDVYFAQARCEPDGRGHAEDYIASTTAVIAPGKTSQTFVVHPVQPIYFPPASLVANATNTTTANSSELGSCVAQDTIFTNGLDY